MRRVLIGVALGAVLATGSVLATAADLSQLSQVVGHYRYDKYSLKMADGRELSLIDLGAKDAYLDISKSGTITLRMTMRAGNTVTETAQVIEAHFGGSTGYWMAQWPDMTYPVHAEIKVEKGALISDTRFNDPSDRERFGCVEHAVLRKQ